jgi:hypothetical protein
VLRGANCEMDPRDHWSWLEISLSVFTKAALADCSLLTILLAGNGVSCIDESQKDASVGGSLPYLWRETR